MPKKSQLAALKDQVSALRKEIAESAMSQLAAGEITTRLNFSTQITQEKPTVSTSAPTSQAIFERCRYWGRESDLLKIYLALRLSVCNHGFSIRAVEKQNQDTVDKWLAEEIKPSEDTYQVTQSDTVDLEPNSTRREAIERFARDAWREKHLFSSVAAAWIDDMPEPVLLPLEKVEYTDLFGVEALKYTHGLTQTQIDALPPAMQEPFRNTSFYVSPAVKMHFKVWKSSRVGAGLDTPDLYSIFRLLGEIESKQFGQNALGFACRSVKRAHLLGHEIKNGPHAGKDFHFWNKKRSDKLLSKWVDIPGFEDYTCNFDEAVEFWLPDPKLFDETLWKGSNMRFNLWGGPLMQMFVTQSNSPYLSNLLKAEIIEERRSFAHFLSWVINKAFNPGTPIKISWSNAIFSEPRLAAEMIKFGKQYGNISSQTFIEEAGFSPEIERARKLAEVGDSDARSLEMPAFDAAHGNAPALGDWEAVVAKASGAKGAEPGNTPGRKPGSKNKE